MGSLLPVDPVDVFAGAIGGIVGRILAFFGVSWAGFAIGYFSASFVAVGDLIRGGIWMGMAADLVAAPWGWGLSMVVGFLNPWVALLTLGYAWFAFQMFWGERDAVKLLGCLLVYEAVRSYVFLSYVGSENGLGVGMVFVLGISAWALTGVWTLSRVVYEAEMRRLDEIAAENEAKREAKERGAREMAAEDEAARERLRRG